DRFFIIQPTVRDVAQARTSDNCDPLWGGMTCGKRSELDCKLEYAITPTVPVPGQPFHIEVTAVNTGEKTFKVQSPAAVVARKGDRAAQPSAPLATELGRGETRTIGRIEGVWTSGTTSWWAEATVKDQKGDSYRAQFIWELKAPAR